MSSSSEEAGPEPPVGMSLCDSAPLLWRVQELRAVRAAGLVGALVGCLPRTPRQNGRLGRPLLLLPEELSVLRGSEHTTEELSVLRGSEHTTEELSVLRSSEHTTEELSVLRGSEHTTEELSVLRGSEHTTEELSVLRGSEHTTEEEDEEMKAEQRLRLEKFLSRSHKEQSSLALEDRKSALTSSHSGDPLRFHAHFMAVCVSLEDSVCLQDILSWARLGSNVKKTLLLCSASPQGGVVYSSLQWSQMS